MLYYLLSAEIVTIVASFNCIWVKKFVELLLSEPLCNCKWSVMNLLCTLFLLTGEINLTCLKEEPSGWVLSRRDLITTLCRWTLPKRVFVTCMSSITSVSVVVIEHSYSTTRFFEFLSHQAGPIDIGLFFVFKGICFCALMRFFFWLQIENYTSRKTYLRLFVCNYM